ncbi:MAG TPA: hypothetical protein VGP07_22040 [Polyangia bacterium]|jgi:hypothetical protein
MAKFDPLSRYVKLPLVTYAAVDIRGRQVQALPTPDAPKQVAAGRHVRKQSDTLDQLASGYLKDPNAFWRLAEVNDAVLPDALAEVEEITIPTPTR